MLRYFFTLLFICLFTGLNAQTRVFQTFKDTWVINTRSTETLQKGHLDIRISHRFGDLAGDLGGWPTFYGLENARDVSIGLDMGFTDNLTLGISRSKGAGLLKQLVNLSGKWRLLSQTTDGKTPVSLAFAGVASLSTMASSDNPEAINFFDSFSHRMVYNAQLLLSRKFSAGFSAQIGAGYTHRNVVPFGEENAIINLSVASRIQLTKVLGLIIDWTLPLNGAQSPFNDSELGVAEYYAPFGIGLEMETGGHVFQINLTNASGLLETDYVPYTSSNWGDGQYRLGFTISRLVKFK